MNPFEEQEVAEYKEGREAYLMERSDEKRQDREAEMPGFYFIWGEEPEGYVSTGKYDKYDNLELTGLMELSEAIELKLKSHNPFSSKPNLF